MSLIFIFCVCIVFVNVYFCITFSYRKTDCRLLQYACIFEFQILSAYTFFIVLVFVLIFYSFFEFVVIPIVTLISCNIKFWILLHSPQNKKFLFCNSVCWFTFLLNFYWVLCFWIDLISSSFPERFTDFFSSFFFCVNVLVLQDC